MSESRAIVLNTNQRRHFEVLFVRLEDSLTRIETLLAGEAAPHVLSIDEDDIPDTFREYAAPVIAALRERINQFATTLELKPRRTSRTRSVAAMLSAEAIRIEDSLSSQLRGYGEVDPTVSRHLDPALKEVAQTLGELARVLDHHSHARQKR